MAAGDPNIEALRAALAVSPDNAPLRRHLAETLANFGRWEEAEGEYREALARAPNDHGLQLGLADVYYRQGKHSAALVIVESLIRAPSYPPRTHLLHARLLLAEGEAQRAVHEYREAVDLDPDLKDDDLAEQLGIDADEFSEVDEGRLRARVGEESAPQGLELERPRITFDDVGGMEPLKDEIRMKIIHPLAHPELYRAYGKSIGGGILMYGPPGCGKTYLARATAGQVQAKFLAVGISDVLDMWIGSSERNLRAIFEQARANPPCVLFFDEVDALGASRSDFKHSASRQVINQFLSELDGVQASNEGVLILAATNAPWHLDSAFRRPGRFDRILFVPPPDATARAEILQLLCQGKPTQGVNYEQIAKKTDGFSGADLKAVLDVAVEGKLREAMKAGAPQPLTTKDLLAAAKTLKPTTREWFSTARNYALYSNQGGLYDDILKYLNI